MENGMNSKIVHIDSVGSLIQELTELYEHGQVESIVMSVLKKDGIVESWWSKESFLKRLGMAENLKITIDLEARE